MGHRGVTGGWAEWAIAHPDFGSLEGAAGHPGCVVLLLAHPWYPALGSQLRPGPGTERLVFKDF